MTTQIRFRTRHPATKVASRYAKRGIPAIKLALVSCLFAMLPAIADTAEPSGADATPTPELSDTLNSQIDAIDLQIAAQLKTMRDELDRIGRTLADEALTLDEIRAEARSFSAERARDEG